MISDLPSERVDVLIIGAGMAGCATAKALADACTSSRHPSGSPARRVCLIDRHRGVCPRFAGEFIHPRGAQVLEDLGFLPALMAAGAVEVDGFTVLERVDGRYVELPYNLLPHARPRGLAVHHKTLVRTMRAVVAEHPAVELCEGWSLTQLLRDADDRVCGARLQAGRGASMRFRDVYADTVVGADGKSSATRRQANLPEHRAQVGFTVGLSLVDAAVPGPRFGNVVLGAWGPMLIYPIEHLAGGHLRYRMTIDLPSNLPAKGRQLFEFLRTTFLPFLPAPLAMQTAAALERCEASGEPLPMAPTVNLSTPRPTAPGLALVGDAAGCSHPITASGMTMGLRDAEVLGNLAAQVAARPGPWLRDLELQRYCHLHDRYVPTRQALAEAIYQVFRGGDAGARAIQDALFDYWGSSQRARERSMSLLSCAEGRPHVFVSEYLRAARFAMRVCIQPRYARHLPMVDRLRTAHGAAQLAGGKLGKVAQVVWANVRPNWSLRASLGSA